MKVSDWTSRNPLYSSLDSFAEKTGIQCKNSGGVNRRVVNSPSNDNSCFPSYLQEDKGSLVMIPSGEFTSNSTGIYFYVPALDFVVDTRGTAEPFFNLSQIVWKAGLNQI